MSFINLDKRQLRRLKNDESRNERLVDLSQMLETRMCDIDLSPCIYFFNIAGIIRFSSALYKIGFTIDIPQKENLLRYGNPFGFIDFLFYPGSLSWESAIHNYFSVRKKKIEIKGMNEIFNLTHEDIKAIKALFPLSYFNARPHDFEIPIQQSNKGTSDFQRQRKRIKQKNKKPSSSKDNGKENPNIIQNKNEHLIVLKLLLGEDPTKECKRDVARVLAEKVNRLPFTTGYLDNIMAGRQEASPHGDMYKALMLVTEEIASALIEYVDGGSGE